KYPLYGGHQRLFRQQPDMLIVLHAQEVDENRLQALFPVPLQAVQIVPHWVKTVFARHRRQGIGQAFLVPDSVFIFNIPSQNGVVGVVENTLFLAPRRWSHDRYPAVKLVIPEAPLWLWIVFQDQL